MSTRSPRTAVVTTSYPRSAGDAAGHFVESEARELARAQHDVHVFAPGAGASGVRDRVHVHFLADRGAFGFPGALARLREHPWRAAGAGEFVVRAARALRREGPFERVQAHFWLPSAWPIATLAPRGAELELVGHGSDVRLFCRLPKQLRQQIARSWLARDAALRVTSEELAELVRAACPELSPRIRVAASPIELGGVPSRAAARAALGFTNEQKIAVIVARLVPGKRVDEALTALSTDARLALIVVGAGPELPALRARFPSARFTGQLPRPEALAFIAAADVLVSASAQEGAPTVVREARALGVPVVAALAGDLASWAARDPGIRLVTSPFGVNARQQVHEVAGLGA